MINKEIKKSDIGTLFSKRLSYLIKREYGEKRGCKKKFYDDFQEVIEKNEIYGYKKNDEYFNVSLAGKHWISGANIPNAEILELLANFFCVSVDFLIGKTDIESTITADLASNYTGLEIHSINLLNKYYREGHQWQLNTIDAINFLLEREETANLLLNMYHFFFGNYTHTKDKKEVIDIFDADDCGGVPLIVSDMQRPLFMSYIMNGLTTSYESYVKNNPRYKDYGKPTDENYVMRWVNGKTGTKLERLEQVKSEINHRMKFYKKLLAKNQRAGNKESIETYSSLIEFNKRYLKIIEDKIKKLQRSKN